MKWISFDERLPLDGQEIFYKFLEVHCGPEIKGTFHKVGIGYLIMTNLGIVPIHGLKHSYWLDSQPERLSEKAPKGDAIV